MKNTLDLWPPYAYTYVYMYLCTHEHTCVQKKEKEVACKANQLSEIPARLVCQICRTGG